MARKSTPARKGDGNSAPQAVRLPRIAKGRRAEFHDDPAIDQLFAIATALTGEISVLFDRLDTVERLLTEARVLSAPAIEAYVPDESAAALRIAAPGIRRFGAVCGTQGGACEGTCLSQLREPRR